MEWFRVILAGVSVLMQGQAALVMTDSGVELRGRGPAPPTRGDQKISPLSARAAVMESAPQVGRLGCFLNFFLLQ